MTETFFIKRNDTADDLQATLKDAANSAVALTGATVKFTMKKPGAAAAKVSKAAAALVDAANGVVKYAWQAGDTDEAGEFSAEFEVTYAGGAVQTFPNSKETRLIVRIREDLA